MLFILDGKMNLESQFCRIDLLKFGLVILDKDEYKVLQFLCVGCLLVKIKKNRIVNLIVRIKDIEIVFNLWGIYRLFI